MPSSGLSLLHLRSPPSKVRGPRTQLFSSSEGQDGELEEGVSGQGTCCQKAALQSLLTQAGETVLVPLWQGRGTQARRWISSGPSELLSP